MFEKDGKWYIKEGGEAFDSKEAAQTALDAASKEAGPSLEDLMAQIEKLKSKNEELIGEKRSVQAKAKEAEEAKMNKLKKEADMSSSDKKKLEVAQMELEKLKGQLEEKTLKENELAEIQLNDSIKKEFKAKMGVDLHDEDTALKVLDKSKFIKEDDGSFNKAGVEQAVAEFREKHAYMIKASDKDVNQMNAKGSGKEELTKAERYQKYVIDAAD